MKKNRGFKRSPTRKKSTSKTSNVPQKTQPSSISKPNVPQQNSGSFMGNAAGAVGTGIGFGVGSSIGHAVIDKAFSSGPEENVQNNQPVVENSCNKLFNDFQNCVTNAQNDQNDINSCNQYVEMMKNMNCGK